MFKPDRLYIPGAAALFSLISRRPMVQSTVLDLRFTMAATPAETALDLSLAAAHDAAPRAEVELEVLALFDECRGGVQRYVRSFGVAPGDCEDVVQDTFLALFRHLQRGGGRSNLRGWVFRVARNLALKRRAGQRRAALISFAATDRVDPAANPEEQLAAGQWQAQLQAVVRALPERSRRCLQLRAAGLRYREIAVALDVSVGTVANALALALTRAERAEAGTARRG